MTDRHNIQRIDYFAGLPAPDDASASDLGRAIEALAQLAPELTAPVVSQEMRLEQYRRAADLGRWITNASDDLCDTLTAWMKTAHGDPK